MPVEIAFFAPDDLEPVVDVFHELGRHYFGVQAGARHAVRAHVSADILGPDSGVRIVVARDGAAVAGLATVARLYPAPQERAQLFMKELYVGAAWRGQGIGERLMRFLARHAVETNCVRFDWTTERTNHGARAFYELLGAATVDEKVYYRLTGAALAAAARADPAEAPQAPSPAASAALIRAARPDDAAAIDAAAYAVAWQHYERNPLVLARPDPASHEWSSALLAAPPETTITRVAEVAGAVVGFVHAQVIDEARPLLIACRYGRVDTVSVLPSHRSQGFGRQLLGAAEAWLAGQGCREVRLNVWTDNQRAVALYRSLGYAPMSMFMTKPLRGIEEGR